MLHVTDHMVSGLQNRLSAYTVLSGGNRRNRIDSLSLLGFKDGCLHFIYRFLVGWGQALLE